MALVGACSETASRNCSGRFASSASVGQDAHRRDRDVTGADGEGRRVIEERQGRGHRRPVEERLAHAHEYDVGRLHGLGREQQLAHLPRDFPRLQIALEAHRSGRAEAAAQRAARLRRDAQRPTRPFRNQHRLDGLSVRQAPQHLLGAVPRHLAHLEGERGERPLGVQRLAQRERQVAGVRPAAHRTLPQSRQDLRQPERRIAAAREPPRQLGPRYVRCQIEHGAHRIPAVRPKR